MTNFKIRKKRILDEHLKILIKDSYLLFTAASSNTRLFRNEPARKMDALDSLKCVYGVVLFASLYPEDKPSDRKGWREGLNNLISGLSSDHFALPAELLLTMSFYQTRDRSLSSGYQLLPLSSGWTPICLLPAASCPLHPFLNRWFKDVIFWPLV